MLKQESILQKQLYSLFIFLTHKMLIILVISC